jgi:hypothetical protein
MHVRVAQVLLLGKGGRTVCMGALRGALGYFANCGFECPEKVRVWLGVSRLRVLY